MPYKYNPFTNNLDLVDDISGFLTDIVITTNSGTATWAATGNLVGSGSITTSGSGSTATAALTGLTNHALLVGAGTDTITKVGPSAIAGQILRSGGSSADPSFSTATYPATAGTSGNVLTSDGTNWISQAASGGSGIGTINGDSGSVTGSTVTFNGASQAGASVSFSGSGTTMSFNTTDANFNTIIGKTAGNGSISGLTNTALGLVPLNLLTSGANNVAIGAFSLQKITTGVYNTGLGRSAGLNYTGSESHNTCIGAARGTAGESNVMRLGATGTINGQVTKAFIAGVSGVTVSSPVMVLMNSSTEQLGTTTFTTGGTFMPVLAFNGSSTGITYGFQTGTYSRIGNVVTFCIHIVLTSKGSSPGQAQITGLPFSAATTTALAMSCDALTLTGTPSGLLVTNSIQLNQITTGTLSNMSDLNFANNSTVDISGSYLV